MDLKQDNCSLITVKQRDKNKWLNVNGNIWFGYEPNSVEFVPNGKDERTLPFKECVFIGKIATTGFNKCSFIYLN